MVLPSLETTKQHELAFASQCMQKTDNHALSPKYCRTLSYEEVRKQVLISNTMFAVTCAVLAFITMAANCPYFVEPARAELSETSKILEKYQKTKKLELCFWKNIPKNQDFEKSQKTITNTKETQCKSTQIQRKSSHYTQSVPKSHFKTSQLFQFSIFPHDLKK